MASQGSSYFMCELMLPKCSTRFIVSPNAEETGRLEERAEQQLFGPEQTGTACDC